MAPFFLLFGTVLIREPQTTKTNGKRVLLRNLVNRLLEGFLLQDPPPVDSIGALGGLRSRAASELEGLEGVWV